MTFKDTTTVGPLRVTDIDVVDATSAVLGELYDFADPSLTKAGWTWNLIHRDGSHGVHNPTFAFTALDAARDALLGGTPGALQLLRDSRPPAWQDRSTDRIRRRPGR